MIRIALPVLLTLVGLVLLALAQAWPKLSPASSRWTEEQAAELRQTEDRLLALLVKLHGARQRGAEIPDEPAPVAALRAKLVEQRKRFERVRVAPIEEAQLLGRLGVGAMFAAVLAYFAARVPSWIRQGRAGAPVSEEAASPSGDDPSREG